MNSDFNTNLRELNKRLEALMELASETETFARQIHRSAAQSWVATMSWRTISNRKIKHLTIEEIETLCKTSNADFILHVPKKLLRIKTPGQKTPKHEWKVLSGPQAKILLVGMSKPGWPFGNKVIDSRRLDRRMDPKTVTRYVAGVTKLIQDGGTNGPYLYQAREVPGVSDSGNGYRFDEQWDYLVIDEGP